MAAHIRLALLKRLGMADNGFYAVKGGVLGADKVLHNGQVNDLIDVQTAGEDEVHDRADLAGVAVFKRENGTVILAALDRFICIREV